MNYIETKAAIADRKKIKSKSKAIQSKLFNLVVDILSNPRELNTIGKPELLKHTNVELWSRRLNDGDRIVYGIEPGIDYNMPDETEIIVFYQYLGHYSDK